MAVKAASIIGVASAGGSLSITWKDCGTSATHAKTTDVEPTSLELGTETAITGTGDLNKEVTGGTYDIELKAGGGLIDSHFTGNNCEAKDFNLPLGIGTLSWDGIACPLATGTTNIGFHTKLAAALPPALATSDIAVRSTDQDSEQLLCVDLHLAEQAALSLEQQWEQYKIDFEKVYPDLDTEVERRSVFNDNMAKAAELQELNPEAVFGATQFSDWTPEEFAAIMLNYRPSNSSLPSVDLSELPLQVDASKDWTGVATTPVKDQKSCGSCWAFSATEQIESDLMLQHDVTEILAPQQLVNCRKNGGSFRFGCTGGNVDKAFEVIESMGGMNREKDYPYRGMLTAGRCKAKKDKFAAKVTSFALVGKGDESAMKRYLGSSGPLSVCVAAGTWNSYKSGILTSCDKNVDHCVQVVGYGDEGASSYWKVRNSWGTKFGEAGHIRIKFGSNLCQINSEPRKATVEPLGQTVV